MNMNLKEARISELFRVLGAALLACVVVAGILVLVLRYKSNQTNSDQSRGAYTEEDKLRILAGLHSTSSDAYSESEKKKMLRALSAQSSSQLSIEEKAAILEKLR
ncbi:MAG: hypothetical protein Q7S50_03390 [bacterium]|nr:hypothetical protein [bacterium]